MQGVLGGGKIPGNYEASQAHRFADDSQHRGGSVVGGGTRLGESRGLRGGAACSG